jgi:hypothetical protein
MWRIMGCDHSLTLKEFLVNLIYSIWMFIFATNQELWSHELMDCIVGCNHSLCRKDILKFIYCFMILFLTVYIFKHFLSLVPFSHHRSAIIFSF